MSEQVGWRGFARAVAREAPSWAATLPQLPRLAHRLLAEDRLGGVREALERLAEQGARRNRLLAALLAALVAAVLVQLLLRF
jgi:ubiquinone biosynthesis protein